MSLSDYLKRKYPSGLLSFEQLADELLMSEGKLRETLHLPASDWIVDVDDVANMIDSLGI